MKKLLITAAFAGMASTAAMAGNPIMEGGEAAADVTMEASKDLGVFALIVGVLAVIPAIGANVIDSVAN